MILPIEFGIFAATLLGIALFHRHTLGIAGGGLLALLLYKLAFTGFDTGPGLPGLAAHFAHEAVTLVNLLCLLVGFALLARHFEDSRLPLELPQYLPDGWTGPLALLAIVFVISSFLDNIAAALIGGALAHTLFGGRVHIGFLAAIVAASNAGGAGSVIGDTTTTMMWISGVAPTEVLHAYVGSVAAFAVFAIVAARQQHRYAPIMKDTPPGTTVDLPRLAVVAIVLGAALATNLIVNAHYPEVAAQWPALGLAVVIALLLTAPWRAPDWHAIPGAAKGALFLLCLVASASLMPVERLPAPTWQTTLGLGFVSAVFDNIPLTALAIEQGGYEWGFLAYAVGFGGSMVWFGSSAGVALCTLYPEARSAGRWLRHGWHVAVGYVVGFVALLWVIGWP